MTYAPQNTRGSLGSYMRQALLRCDCSLCAQGRHHKCHSICRNQTRPLSPASTSPYSYKLHRSWLRRRALVLAVNKAGHLECQATVEPGQTNYGLPNSPDISLLSPELQQQWHRDRNMHLGAIQIKPHSSIKAVWQCNECPAGQPHIWTVDVKTRTSGTQCPYCTNRRLCLHNSLATVAPGVAMFWNHSKNVETPEQVLAGSGSRAHWKCPACKYEWQTNIRARVLVKSGCPKCSRVRSKGNKGSQPTFAEAQPAELAEWDHERNEAEGFYPHEITLGSRKKVHWICSRCPKGQLHRWTATPNSRVGCAVCNGKQACVCNSLESLFPSHAAEFDVDMNGFAPSQIAAWSNKKVWWRNAKRGSWRQAVNVRTDRRLPSNARPM
ncbi:hypothetical protein ABBQ38_001848 [Trebouxia sp. C0009 RCD-2024]